MPLEATLAVCVGFNLALALLIVFYIASLRVNPNDFRWLQFKAKARRTVANRSTSVVKVGLRLALCQECVCRGQDCSGAVILTKDWCQCWLDIGHNQRSPLVLTRCAGGRRREGEVAAGAGGGRRGGAVQHAAHDAARDQLHRQAAPAAVRRQRQHHGSQVGSGSG